MEFGLSEEQSLLQDSVRRLLDSKTDLEQIREYGKDGSGFNQDIWNDLAELGAIGVIIPGEYGGSDLSFLDAEVILEAIGRTVAPVPFLGTAILAPIAILNSGNESQKDTLLGSIATGDLKVGAAISEVTGAREGAGVTLAGGKLNGKSMFVIDALVADAFVVAVGNDTLAWVKRDAAGLEVNKLTTVDKTRGVAEVLYDNVECELIGVEGSAGDTIDKMVTAGRIALAADTFGAAEVMIYKARDYALQRKQFDRLIGSFQAVKHMCAEMISDLEPCRSLVWYAAHAFDDAPEEADVMACHAKAHTSEVGKWIARTATEVHGGMGFTELMGVHYWLKRIGLNRQLLGGPEATRHAAAVMQGFVAA